MVHQISLRLELGYKRLRALWHKATEPSSALTHAQERQRARLLASLLLTSIVIIGITIPGLAQLGSPNAGVAFLTVLVLIVAYYFSRTAHYKSAALLTALLTSAIPLAFVLGNPVNHDGLAFTVVSILLSSILLPGPYTLAVIVITNLALLLIPLLQPRLQLEDTFAPLFFNLIVSGLVWIAHTIGEQHQRQIDHQAKVLSDSEQRYRLMAENATDIIARHALDGTILYISPACHPLLGYEPSELIGLRSSELAHPEDLSILTNAYETVAKMEGIRIATYRLRRKDGLYVWFESTSKAVRLPGNTLTREIITISRDVTARKQVDEILKKLMVELSEQKNILATILTTTPDHLAIFDDKGRYIYANPPNLDSKGFQLEQVVGKTFRELDFSADVCERFEREYQMVVTSGEAISDFWLDYPTVTGKRDFQYTYSPVRDTQGKIMALVSTSRDITEQRQAEQKRLELAVERERVKTLQHLISDTSHDLKTPLTTLNHSLYLLKKFISDPERREHYAQILQTQVSHLVRILDDMDSMAKLDRATEEFEYQSIDVNVLLLQIVAEQEALALQKNHKLVFLRAESALPKLRLDMTKIRRAITNLMVNAFNYTPTGGTITIRAYQREPRQIVIEIQDTGIGISAEELKLIFERFYRAQTSTGSEGSGLGLAITKKIVESHDGSIEVESVPGEGSTFRVVLPLTE